MPVIEDNRGNFIKTFVYEEYLALGLPTHFVEEYYSRSIPKTLRGLHFLSPPHEYAKLVTCVFGNMKDVILDLRVGSPFYGQVEVIEMNGSNGQVLFLPPGIAHGFLAHTEVIVWYRVTSRYAPLYSCIVKNDEPSC
jgi:dTDP-4-dehydrorhamnose 3,5-epimerase and related enzymes